MQKMHNALIGLQKTLCGQPYNFNPHLHGLLLELKQDAQCSGSPRLGQWVRGFVELRAFAVYGGLRPPEAS